MCMGMCMCMGMGMGMGMDMPPPPCWRIGGNCGGIITPGPSLRGSGGRAFDG